MFRRMRYLWFVLLLLGCTIGHAAVDPHPLLAQADDDAGEWHTVRWGDTWYSLSRRYGVPVRELQAANPDHRHFRDWLIVGHRLWIPGEEPTTECPAAFVDYGPTIESRLNAGMTLSELESWLTDCNVISAEVGSIAQYALRGVYEADIVIVIDNEPAAFFAQGKLLVYHDVAGSYQLAHEVDGEGRIELLAVADPNQNGTRDLVWTDTYCGAHTCVGELKVEQWTGSSYADWIYGNPYMETATYTVADTIPSAVGDEIIVHGGTIGSVGAGPVRQRTETFVSYQGQPYQLWGTDYDATTCYYHRLVAENAVYDLANAPESGGYPVIQYELLLADATLTLDDCPYAYGPEMLGLLQDFTRFRLVVGYSAYNEPADATTARDAISSPAIQGAADTFLAAYSSTPDVDAACAAVATYAAANPDSWDYLADWGYGNPPFHAEWLCAGSAAVTGIVWNDYCPITGMFGSPNASCQAGMEVANGIWEAGEAGLPDVTVHLYEGDCTTLADFPARITTTGPGGSYTFDLLTAGDYCVVVDATANGNGDLLIPGQWTAPADDGTGVAKIPVTVTTGAFLFFEADFGWDYQLD